MRNVSSAFRQALEDGNRNYQCSAEITLTDNTHLSLTNTNLLINGLSIDDNVSGENGFTALGSVIVNAVEIRANNLSGTYSEYDFRDGIITIYVGLTIGTTVESIKIGTYIINEASFKKSVLSLYCLDYLSKFDKPYSNSTLTYPATLASILSNACIDCVVTLGSTTFPNSTLTIPTAPQGNLTYREVVSFVATIAGCFVKCNANGELLLQWFDFDAEHELAALSSYDYSTADITITGIKIITQTISESETTEIEHLFGTDDYIITITNNPFITESNVTAIGNYLESQIVGLTFRMANISHLSDPTIEAGDVAVVTDRHDNTYDILITNTKFNVSSYQETKCSAVEPTEQSVTRFTETQKTYATAKQLIKQEKTARQQMGQALTNAINAKAGMYETRVQESGGGYTYYLHDKPVLAESTAVMKITNEAVAVTPNYQATTPTWYGLTVNGNFIANIMSTIGIDFDWGTGGTLTLGGVNNGNGILTILDAENNSIGTWNNTGISLTKGSLRSSDYVYGTGPYFCQAGMIINLNNKTIMTPKFSVIGGVLRATDGIFSGQIIADSGNIGGWTISKNYQIVYNDPVTEGTASTQYSVFIRANKSYVPSTDVVTPADGDTIAFGVYHREYTGSSYGSYIRDFSVSHNGTLRAENAYIKGAITATSLTLESGVTVSAGKISGLASVATSGSYADLSNTPDLTVYISKDGTIGSTPAAGATGFKVSSAGLLTASNAVIYGTIYATAGEFTGKITARTGAIGGFSVSSAANQGTTADGGHIYANSLYTHSSDSTYEYESGLAGGGAYNNAAFYIRRIETGDTWNNSSYMFYVRNDGYMYATKGSLGGWNITNSQINKSSAIDTSISTDQTQYQVYMRADSTVTDTTYAFCAMQRTYRNGSYDAWSSNFYVRYDGYLFANKANIKGTITADGGTIGGWSISKNWQLSYTHTETSGSKTTQYQVGIRATGGYDAGTDTTTAPTGSTAAFFVQSRVNSGSGYDAWKSIFRVNHDGSLIASNVTLNGGTISSTREFYGTSSWDLEQCTFQVLNSGGAGVGLEHGYFRLYKNGDGYSNTIVSIYTTNLSSHPEMELTGHSDGFVITKGSLSSASTQKLIVINTGLNPDNYEEDVIIYGKERITSTLTVGSTVSVVGTSLKLGAGTSNEATISCHTGTGGRVRISNGLTVGSGAAVSGYEVRIVGSMYVNTNVYVGSTMSADTVTQRSDENMKNIIPWDDKLDELIDHIEPIFFRWKDSKDKRLHIGVGARKTEGILKELGLTETGIVTTDMGGYAVNYIELSMILLHKCQVMFPVMQNHEKRIKELENEVYELKQLIAKLI